LLRLLPREDLDILDNRLEAPAEIKEIWLDCSEARSDSRFELPVPGSTGKSKFEL
jgi:hypothetical protein